jgi:hypothetical protein
MLGSPNKKGVVIGLAGVRLIVGRRAGRGWA